MKKESDSGMIDLGRECKVSSCKLTTSNSKPSGKKKIVYPTLYISGCEHDMNMPMGEFTATIKGKVVSMSCRDVGKDGDEDDSEPGPDIDHSCEIEVHCIKVIDCGEKKKEGKSSEESLNDAFDKISKGEAPDSEEESMDEEEDAADDGADEEDEGEE